MQEWKWLASRRLRKWLRAQYVATDFGRRYGWWLCVDGVRVAELNYWRYDIDSQFWHEYRLIAWSPRFDEIGFDPGRWCSDDVSVESRYSVGFRIKGLLMAAMGATSSGDLVAIRGASIPEEVFYATLQGSERPGQSPS
jgi:hypothetical protein